MFKDKYFKDFFLKHEKCIAGTAIIVHRSVLVTVFKVNKRLKENTSSKRSFIKDKSNFLMAS
jgi:hypothetical protein